MATRRAALVIGASRGIGRQIAITLARNNYAVIVAAKTEEVSEKFPNSIRSVAKEILDFGGVAIPFRCDGRFENDIRRAVNKTIDSFGSLDVAIYNAGVIDWKPVLHVQMKQFDLMMNVNLRGAYAMVLHAVPPMLQKNHGRIVLVAPPIYNRFFKGKTTYSISKVGMTVLAKGMAFELKGTGVSISTLWPTTVIKSRVTDTFDVPNAYMRTPEIFADAVLGIVNEPSDKLNGAVLLDEDYLRSKGQTDFSKYQCEPGTEPPRMMPKKLPDLRVKEEDQQLPLQNRDSKL